MEFVYSTRATIAAAGLYVGPTPSATLPGGGANVRITSTAHGLTSGQNVTVSGTTGVTGLNATWLIRVIDANTYELMGSGALTGTPAGTAAVALPDLDISSITGEWSMRVTVYGTGLVSLEDTVNAFSATERRFLINAQAADEGQTFLFSWHDWKGGHRFGTASAKMRLRLVSGTNVAVSVSVNSNG